MLVRVTPVVLHVGDLVEVNGEIKQGRGKVEAAVGFNGDGQVGRRGWRTGQPFPQVKIRMEPTHAPSRRRRRVKGALIHMNGDDLAAGKVTLRGADAARAAAGAAAPEVNVNAGVVFAVGNPVVVTTERAAGCGVVSAVYNERREIPRSGLGRMRSDNPMPQLVVDMEGGSKLWLDFDDIRTGRVQIQRS